ncbi:hypothetical protein [Planobispora longispora]|uniref:Uncharacterized protein n=1 Tax=Planobispora longispora TaxID=28887 RepID=A0A8J3RHP1_9ACTN|nr:hypothetical protein [Planobispora longispora]GIH73839.1 hypothetical protein Plo01_02680 [Planobispora longispora]
MGKDGDGRPDGLRRARAQGAFNVASGLWPLLHLPSFEKVFGPKQDDWLVRTVAGLLLGVGWTQLRAEATPAGLRDARRIGVATAATLLAVDLVYVPRGRIRPTYLLDAAAEIAWLAVWLRRPGGRTARGRPRPAARVRRGTRGPGGQSRFTEPS